MSIFSKWSNDDYESASLNIIHGKLQFLNDVEASIDGGNQQSIDRERQNIAELSAWAQTLTDRRFRKAVEGWIEFAKNGLKEYEYEFRTHKERNEQDKWEREEEEKDKRAEALTRELKISLL